MLTEEQVAQYSRDGSTVCKRLLTQEEVAALLSDAESLFAREIL